MYRLHFNITVLHMFIIRLTCYADIVVEGSRHSKPDMFANAEGQQHSGQSGTESGIMRLLCYGGG